MQAQPTITRATIGRLHNLGNYEHVRYEVTVEIPPGNHAGAVIQQLVWLLDNLEPKDPVSDYDLERAKRALDKPVEEWPEWERDNKPAYEKYVERHEAWKKGRAEAHAALGNLPVQVQYKDAKDTWEQ